MRNPAAYNLIVDGKYRKRIVKSKKRYTRKERGANERESYNEPERVHWRQHDYC